MSNERFSDYTRCKICGFIKYCRMTEQGFICKACSRDDLTLEQKIGKRKLSL